MLSNSASFTKFDFAGHFGESSIINIPDNWQSKGVSIDSREIKSGELFVAIAGENSDGHNFVEVALDKGASAAVVDAHWYRDNLDKYVGKPLIAVKDTLRALGNLANIHRRNFNVPVVAIGGSNGKTTTKNMTAAVLSQKFNVLSTYKNFNNRIGVPLMLFQLDDKYEIAVIEIGTNEPGEIPILCDILEPTHGLITNIGKEHLEKLIDLDGVEIEESFLFGWLHKIGGTAFINNDDERLGKYIKLMEDEITFGTMGDMNMIKADIELNDNLNPVLYFYAGERKFYSMLQTTGFASGLNALAAAAVGFHFGLTDDEIKMGLESYQTESGQGYGRMLAEKLGNITLINDCYNANPDSMKMALNTIEKVKTTGKKISVLGDMRELGKSAHDEHKSILNLAIESSDMVFITGEEMKKAYDKLVNNETLKYFSTKEDLLSELLQELPENGIVLVKGSRGMAMEEIIKGIKDKLQ